MNTLDVDSCHSDLPCDSKKLVKRGHLTPSFLIVLKAFYCSNERLTLEKSVLETPIYITNSVDETKLSCNTSTAAVTVSLKTYPLFTIIRRGRREKLALGLGCFHLLSSTNVWVIQNSYLGKPSSLLWRLILELKHPYSFLSILDAAVKMVSCHGSPILNAFQ